MMISNRSKPFGRDDLYKNIIRVNVKYDKGQGLTVWGQGLTVWGQGLTVWGQGLTVCLTDCSSELTTLSI